MPKKLKLNVLYDLQGPSRTNTKKRCSFHHRGVENVKLGSQDIPRVTGKFGLGKQNETGQRLTEFRQENALVIANILFLTTQETISHMDITK